MKYYCIKQHDITDCGAACLATICRQNGYKIGISKIREVAGTDKQGTNSFRKRLEVCFLRWFFLLEFLFREQEHGLEFWQQVYWSWISKKALEHASVEFCWRV